MIVDKPQVNPLLLPEILRLVFLALSSDINSLLRCAFVCRTWWKALMSCTALWTALAQQHIAPVFPQWQVYAATAYADRGGDTLAQAVFHVLSPFCFYCGKPTPWFFAMSCIRVCRGCFHKPNSPVELCTLAFAKKESRLSQQETKVLAKIVLEKRKRVGLADSTQPCTLVLRSSARALARARQRPLTPESWQTSSSPSSSSAESYSSPSSSPTEPRPITASKAASPGQRSTLLTRHFRSESKSWSPRRTRSSTAGGQSHPPSLAVVKALWTDPAGSSSMTNIPGQQQRRNAIHPLSLVTYHTVMPLAGFFDCMQQPLVVHCEQQLRAALDAVEAHRFPDDRLVHVVLADDIQLTATLEPMVPVQISGFPMMRADGRWRAPRLSVEGAHALLVVTTHTVLANVELEQCHLTPNSYMCAVQVEPRAVLVMRQCRVRASGSAVRIRNRGQVAISDSELFGITSICTDHEQSLLRCQHNTLAWYGEWPIQICGREEEPLVGDYHKHNTIKRLFSPQSPIAPGRMWQAEAWFGVDGANPDVEQ